MKNITLTIADMSCEGCANRVKTALSGIEGVHRADVSLEEKKATVVIEDHGSTDELVAAVSQAGYSASVAG